MNAAQSARSIKKRRAPEKAADCLQYERMYESGICEVEPGLFSMTMAFTDVNFQLARQEEQKSLFTQYSEFLNYFDPDTHLQISLVTRRVDEAEFRRDTFLPLRGDARDRYSEEMNRVISEKALQGQNGLIREKYITISLHEDDYRKAQVRLLKHAEDIQNLFKRMGSTVRRLSGIERLNLLHGITRPEEVMEFSYDWLLAEDSLTTKDFIAPSGYNWKPEHDDSRAVYNDRYQFGEYYGKVLYLRDIAPQMKDNLLMQMMAGIMLRWPEDDLVIIDPENEYARLVEAFGGEVIEISASSKSHINPMDISEDYGDEGNPIQLKSQFLRDFCQLVLNSKELSAQECSLVDRAALITYQKYLLHPEREQMPSLHDFYNNLSLQGPQAKALTMALSMYVDGTMDLFAHQTNVDLQNHCICFNTVKLGKSMQSIGMMTVLDQIWNRITRNRVLGRRTWIFTDEFQLLLGNSACTNYYFELSSRARKWGAILTSITQHVRSVLNNEDARRMLSDCGYIKLLNQAPDDANDIARLLHISDEEKRYIENAEVGSGLLIADKVVVPFNNTFPQDTELFRLMDTNPNRKK